MHFLNFQEIPTWKIYQNCGFQNFNTFYESSFSGLIFSQSILYRVNISNFSSIIWIFQFIKLIKFIFLIFNYYYIYCDIYISSVTRLTQWVILVSDLHSELNNQEENISSKGTFLKSVFSFLSFSWHPTFHCFAISMVKYTQTHWLEFFERRQNVSWN